MTEYCLDGFSVRPFPYEETRQAVPQIVEPEAHLLTFFQHTHFHRSRAEIIFHQHIGDTGLFALSPGTRKNPVCRLGVGRLLLPLANEACE
jgi:hypothetical protein